MNYDTTLTKSSAYDAFYGRSVVCQGYALLFQAFAERLGLNSEYVNGLAASPDIILLDTVNSINHAWNIVELDGKWYQLDTTFGDADGYTGKGAGKYKDVYFLRGTDAFNENHKLSNESKALTADYIFPTTDFVSSTQSSSIPVSLYKIKFDPIYMERLNIDEEYTWLIDNNGINLTFENSNPSIVNLTDDGKVTALKEGKATLTAINRDLNINHTLDIVVSKEKATLNDNDKYYTTIKSVKNLSLEYGKTAQLQLTLKDEYGVLKTVKYTPKDKSIATIDKNGNVTGIRAGTTDITITCDNGSNIKAKVTVKPIKNLKERKVKIGKRVSLRDAVILSKNGYKDLKFELDTTRGGDSISLVTGKRTKNKDMAKISRDGYVTGKYEGTIYVKIKEKSTSKVLGIVPVKIIK